MVGCFEGFCATWIGRSLEYHCSDHPREVEEVQEHRYYRTDRVQHHHHQKKGWVVVVFVEGYGRQDVKIGQAWASRPRRRTDWDVWRAVRARWGH